MEQFFRQFRGIVAVAFGTVVFLSAAVQAAQQDARIRYNPVSTKGMQQRTLMGSELDVIRHPGLPDTVRVLAIRVDFQHDTLATTTGDGSFFYEIPDTVDAEDWLIDPPPHDRQYFEDQFLGARNYFQRFSHGKVTVEGDVYPSADRAAYRMPYPIWHINYGGEGDEADERLNRTLTQLFVDAWQAADADLAAEGVDYNDYDYFVIFHAGAGNEFDTGFDTTPHDIPSVYIGEVDLRDYSDYPNGIPLSGGFVMRSGAILPEMQRQGDVEVGLTGTVCTHVGYLMGMPHLYQAETGKPGIGLLGLMDRGFGGFFGFAPIPPSAWMRYYMGWEDATEITQGEIRLGVLQLPDSVFSDSLHRLVKVPINEDEYYLLEARRRDPQEEGDVWYDSTYALDPDGDTLVLRYDYSFDVLHDADFGVPVWVEDQDFDFPSSGILIWHINESRIEAGLLNDRIQESKERRGVKLVEADGSWDIGEEYPFLTPGDGSEYGVIDDAWFRDNEVWPESNRGHGRDIYFGSDTAPATVTNAGAQTHLRFDQFADIADTMSCRVGNEWAQRVFPDRLPTDSTDGMTALPCDVNGDGVNEVLFAGYHSDAFVYDGDGNLLYQVALDPRLDAYAWLAADLDGNGLDEVVAVGYSFLTVLTFDGAGAVTQANRIVGPLHQDDMSDPVLHAMIVGPENDPHLYIKSRKTDQTLQIASFSLLDTTDTPVVIGFVPSGGIAIESLAMAQVGGAWSDTVGVVTNAGELFLFRDGVVPNISTTLPDWTPGPADRVGTLISADFDGDGQPDFAGTCGNRIAFWFAREQFGVCHSYDVGHFYQEMIPLDTDHDGVVELAGVRNSELIAYEATGVLAEGSGVSLKNEFTHSYPQDLFWVDVSSGGDNALLARSVAYNRDAEVWPEVFDGFEVSNGREIYGFPLMTVSEAQQTQPVNVLLAQLDDDDDPEVVLTASGTSRFIVYNLPIAEGQGSIIHWGMKGGNPQGTFALQTTPAAGTQSNGLENTAYCWPNPALNGDDAHFRFRSSTSGTASVRVFDLVGREVAYREQLIRANQDEEIIVGTADLPTGTYAARLEAGGEYKIIRFAVVK